MKPIKVLFMGEKMCEVYPHATRFQVFKFRVRQFFIKLTRVVIVLGILYGAFTIGTFTHPSEVYSKEVVDVFPQKLADLKSAVVTKIESCESTGKKEDDGLIIFDTNNKASIGTLQFQISTVIHYYKTLYGKDLTRKEAILIALDSEKARSLANDVIFTTDKGLTNWVNCSNKYNLTGEVALIKKLEK